MTDQDNVTRFANGDPLHPLAPKPSLLHVLVTIGTAIVVLTGLILLCIATLYLIFALFTSHRASADELPHVFDQPGECFIDMSLRVTGDKRAACVDKLETAARLARGEMRVNEPRKRR